MNRFHLIFLIFSIIQFIFGIENFILFLVAYYPKYGFNILTIIRLINSIWLLGIGIAGIIYSFCNGGKIYLLILFIDSIFVGLYFFGSILMMNPCGIFLIDSSQCKINQSNKEIEYQMNESGMSNDLDKDYYGAFLFGGIDFFLQSIVYYFKIIILFAMDEKAGEYVKFIQIISIIVLSSAGPILYIIVECFYWHRILIYSASSCLGCSLILLIIMAIIIYAISKEDDSLFEKLFTFLIYVYILIIIAGLILTIVFGVKEKNPDTKSLSLGAGIFMIIFEPFIAHASLIFIFTNIDSKDEYKYNDEDDEYMNCSKCCNCCKRKPKDNNKREIIDNRNQEERIVVPLSVFETTPGQQREQPYVMQQNPLFNPSSTSSSSSSSSSQNAQ